MKKRIIIISTIILIISGCLIGYLCIFNNKDTNEKVISGEKIVDGLYKYELDIKENTNYNTKVIDNTIYYLIEKDGLYDFYKKDIYNNDSQYIGTVGHNKDYCYFNKENVTCSDNETIVVYDLNLKSIYEGNHTTVIPYKDKLIKIKDNKIYDNDTEHGTLNVKLNEYNVYDYDKFDNNLYIYYSDFYTSGCMYDYNNNTCLDAKYADSKKYQNGFYFIEKDKITIKDVNTNEEKEFDNPIKDKFLILTQIKDNTLFYFKDDYLKIYNLETGSVNLLDYRITDSVSDLVINNNLLYLISDKVVYLVNLDEIKTTTYKENELNDLLEQRLLEHKKTLEEKYNITIKIRKDANLNLKLWDQKITGETEYDRINDSLDSIEEVASTFGEEFFKEFIHDEYTGIVIYIASNIDAKMSMAGEAFRYYDTYTIISNTYSIKSTLYHELMHTMEDAVIAKRNDIFENWNKYNPKDFKYKIDYNEQADTYKYTPDYKDTDIYFVDNYAETNELEDRARIFENICMKTDDVILNNKYLLEKAKYIKEEILKYYPMLNNSNIFNNIK